MDPIQALCEAAVQSIAGDVREGLIGTHHVGLHVVFMLADEKRVVYEVGFGRTYTRSGLLYRDIARKKADLAFEYRRSFNELMGDERQEVLGHDLHNGFFFENGVIVALAGAGHLGNVAYGRRLLKTLMENPLFQRAPVRLAAV